MGRGMSGNLNRGKRAMKPYGNVILMTLICIVIFWVFMALRPAQAQSFSPYAGRGCYASSWARCATLAQIRAYARRAQEQIARERAQKRY
jgi:hypothetical protein